MDVANCYRFHLNILAGGWFASFWSDLFGLGSRWLLMNELRFTCSQQRQLTVNREKIPASWNETAPHEGKGGNSFVSVVPSSTSAQIRSNSSVVCTSIGASPWSKPKLASTDFQSRVEPRIGTCSPSRVKTIGF